MFNVPTFTFFQWKFALPWYGTDNNPGKWKVNVSKCWRWGALSGVCMKGGQESPKRFAVKMQLRLLWWQCSRSSSSSSSKSSSGFPSQSPGREDSAPYKAKAGFTPAHLPERKGGFVTSAALKIKVKAEILKRHEDEAAGSCSLLLHLAESSFCKVSSPYFDKVERAW